MKNYFLKSIVFISLIAVFIGCSKDDGPGIEVPAATSPIVTSGTTAENVKITYTSIKIDGEVTADGGSAVTSRGVCWSTSQNPTINGNKTTETSNVFTSTINDLVANSTYYFRVYATNDVGTTYGAEQSYRTSSLDATTWDFLLIHGTNSSWHADVTFNADGTTIYDDPLSPGNFIIYGTWSLSGNTLTYDRDSLDTTNSTYQFTGTLLNDTMSGTYTFGTQPLKSWTAILY